MRIAGRTQAVIDLLNEINASDQAADRLFEKWARQHRYAGSKDRRAISDIFYTILRHKGLLAWSVMGGVSALQTDDAPASENNPDDAESAVDVSSRLLVFSYLRRFENMTMDELNVVADGERFAPEKLNEDESRLLSTMVIDDVPSDPCIAHSVPDWAVSEMRKSLGENFDKTVEKLNERAPIDLRVNTARISLAHAKKALEEDGIISTAVPLSQSALRVSDGRNIVQTSAYLDGLIEVQDAAAQAVCDFIGRADDTTILDYCAGAGGKSLALAAITEERARIYVHDIDPRRLRALWPRLKRASFSCIENAYDLPSLEGKMDLVVADVPCSGSGRWRRNPETKWQMTTKKLQELCQTQAKILDEAAQYVAPDGRLAYVTCSLLDAENRAQIDAFLARNKSFVLANDANEHPVDVLYGPATHDCDGLYACVLTRLVT